MLITIYIIGLLLILGIGFLIILDRDLTYGEIILVILYSLGSWITILGIGIVYAFSLDIWNKKIFK